MFDVVRFSNKKNLIVYYCINVKKEKSLINEFAKKQEHNKRNHLRLKKVSLPYILIHPLEESLLMEKKKIYLLHSFACLFREPNVSSPPPKNSIAMKYN